MKAKWIAALVAAAVLLSVPEAYGADRDFYADGEIVAGDNWDNVNIYGDSVVTMSGGTIDEYLRAYNSSTINMAGGTIGQDLYVYNASAANVSGGEIVYDLNILGSGTTNVYAGATISDDVYIDDLVTVYIYGGTIGDNLQGYASSTVNIHGGSIADNVGAHGSSVFHLRGGATDYVLWADQSSTVNVYGYGLELTSSGGSLGNGQVTGSWIDSGAFEIDLDTAGTYSHITLHEIPEGDANGDEKVDSADLAIWQQHYDPLGVNENTFAMGDWDGNGLIDSADLALWQQNYDPIGHTPEPGTLALLAIGGLVVLKRRRYPA